MKKSGCLYIASNPAFLSNLLKIGITCEDLDTRFEQLSKPTGVPDEFRLVYSCEVSDVLKAESRIHLLLRDYRYNPRKEFFKISKHKAISVLERVRMLLEYNPNTNIYLHNDFIHRRFNIRMSGRQHSIFYMTLGHSHNNSFLDKIQGFPPDIADGFLDVDSVHQYHQTQPSQIRRLLKGFVVLAQNLTVSINDGEPFNVYQNIRYGKGQLCWSFTPRMKEQFLS